MRFVYHEKHQLIDVYVGNEFLVTIKFSDLPQYGLGV